MVDLVFPWSLDKFEGDRVFLKQIVGDLNRRYSASLKARPDPRTEKAIISLATELIERNDNSQIPWVLAVSNSSQLLQAFADYIPIVMALTKHRRSLIVNTDKLISNWVAPLPKDDFADDAAGEALHRVESAGLVIWESFTALKKGGESFESRFLDLLNKRMRKGMYTVFLGLYQGTFNDKTVGRMMTSVQLSMGKTIPEVLLENARMKAYKMPANIPSFDMEEM